MTAVLVATLFLILVFWGLLKLRSMREKIVKSEKPADKVTILLGLYYVLSRGCLQFYRDRNAYPSVVCGNSGGLIELGYLRDEPLAAMTKSLRLFSIVVTDKAGCGICLAHIKLSLAQEMVRRLNESRVPFELVDYKSGQFKPLTGSPETLVNLTLPLPVRPVGSMPSAPNTEATTAI